MADDPFNLQRFVEAQEDTYAGALAEIGRGSKRGHWMWFIFPQLRGLGRSEMAHRFGISSLDEARAYLAHPVLGIVCSSAWRHSRILILELPLGCSAKWTR